jgi:hypothetical protein
MVAHKCLPNGMLLIEHLSLFGGRLYAGCPCLLRTCGQPGQRQQQEQDRDSSEPVYSYLQQQLYILALINDIL